MNFSKFHRFLASRNLSLQLSVKLRNQISCVIQHYVSKSCDMRYNGEFYILGLLINYCNSFVDAGANKGEWSNEVLKLAKQVNYLHLFEPQKKLYNELTIKFTSTNHHVHNIALSDISQNVNFIEDGRSSRIACKVAHKEEILTTERLDNIVNGNADFIKIDCEGHDYKVILGLENLLSYDFNKFIQFEYNDLWLENSSTLLSCIHFLKSYNYKVFRINQNSVTDFDYNLLGDYYRYSNFIAAHESQLAPLEKATNSMKY
jgi:FkbM family methyltransferase